jgi:hypothetical protein
MIKTMIFFKDGGDGVCGLNFKEMKFGLSSL